MKINFFDHVHIYSRDPDASLEFYRRCFNSHPVGSFQDSHDQKNVFVSLGGNLLVIGPYPPGIKSRKPPAAGNGALKNGYGISHFGINVKNLESSLMHLKAMGVEPFIGPESASFLNYVYIQAPDGVIIELTEYRVSGVGGFFLSAVLGFDSLYFKLRSGLTRIALKMLT